MGFLALAVVLFWPDPRQPELPKLVFPLQKPRSFRSEAEPILTRLTDFPRLPNPKGRKTKSR